MAENWKYPRTKFADMNLAMEQVEHVISEAKEVLGATRPERALEEVIDLEHSVETLMRIMTDWSIKVYGKDRVPEFREKVIAKNKVRGYYELSEGSQEES